MRKKRILTGLLALAMLLNMQTGAAALNGPAEENNAMQQGITGETQPKDETNDTAAPEETPTTAPSEEGTELQPTEQEQNGAENDATEVIPESNQQESPEAEPQFTTQAAGPNLAIGSTASATNAESGNGAERAVDGERGTRWATDQNRVQESLTVTLQKPAVIERIELYFDDRANTGGPNVVNYTIEGQTETGETVTLFTRQGESQAVSQHETLTISAPEAVKTLTLSVQDILQNGTWANVGIQEMEIYGREQESTLPPVPVQPEERPDTNHMRQATRVTASSEEDGSMTADKIKDGSAQTRWSSNYTDNAKHWIKAVLEKPTKIQEIRVRFNNRTVVPMPSNVAAFDLVYTDEQNQEQTVRIPCTPVGADSYETLAIHQFETAIIAKDIKLTGFDTPNGSGQDGWKNVGIVEVELYSNHQKAPAPDLNQIIQKIKNSPDKTIDGDTFVLPEVPEGITIRLNGADLEQLVGGKLEGNGYPVVHPLETKTVNISYELSNGEDTIVTDDIPYTVTGQYASTAAPKPKVVPEIQEWHAENAGTLPIEQLTAVHYDDPALETVVDEFIGDYEDFTGIRLHKEMGAPDAGVISFSTAAPDALLGDEGYTMTILEDRVIVASQSSVGNMYAMQTLLQMYRLDNSGYPVGQMRDYPRFPVRGLLLDVARKPVSLEMMNQFARTMRYYKMNDFQTHLSDNYIFMEQYMQGNDDETKAMDAYDAFRLECGLTGPGGSPLCV